MSKTPHLLALLGLIAAVAVQVPARQAQAAQAAPGATYYVDAAGGDDTASGRTADQPWRSLAKVSATTFQPGDAILLKAGQRWTGQLWPKGSGTAGLPITVDRYGAGAKPRLDGAGGVGDVVRLNNQEHWTVRNLEITNTVPATGTPGENLRDLRGVHVTGDNSQTLDGFVIDGVDVHDVTGEVNWIGGSVSGNAPGVRFQTGWDGSKRTGGIVFDTTVPDIHAPPATPTVLNDVVVQNSTVSNTSFAGIVVKQYTGDGRNAAGETIATATGWGTRTGASDPRFAPHTNIVIRGNFITQAATDYGCNGIYLTNVRGAVVERNVVYRTGTSGIETYYADDVTIQFNEVYETTQKAGGADSNGIDPDKGTTGQVVQYNYVHHNGDGILLCQFAFGDAIVRENVIAGNSRYQIYLHSDRAAAAKIYHNTIYNDRSDYLIYGYGSYLAAAYDLTNNVLYSTRAGAALTTSTTIRYDSNLYGGATLDTPDDDLRAIIADPLLTNATVSGPYGTAATGPQLATAHAFRLRAASPAIDAGAVIPGNGGRDFAGTALYNGAPDLGAFEYTTAAGATTETVAGSVAATGGAPIAGATVTVGSATTTSGPDGRFAVPGVPFAEGVTVTAARDGYRTASQTVDVRTGNRTTVHLALASTSVVGAISGRVLDQTGGPLAAATVTVRDGDRVIGTGTSAADGTFTVAGVPVGEGYTLTATFPGLNPASQPGLSVTPATTTVARALLLSSPVPDYRDVQNFDAVPAGTLPNGTNGLVVSPAGGRVDVVEVPSAADHSAKLTRTANSGSTSLQRHLTPALTGLVTVEAKVMRDDPYVSGNNWYGVPYIRGTNGVNAISVAFTRNTIVAYSGASTVTVGAYELGRWYRLRTVIDVVNQRFDLYLDGTAVLSGAAFRAPMDGVAQIDFYANSSNYGSVHLDDLRVSQGAGLLPDDAGLLPDDAGLLPDDAGLLPDDAGLLPDDAGLLPDDAGLLPDDAGLLTPATDHGTPTAGPGGGYLLAVPAAVTEVEVWPTRSEPLAVVVS
ncbi:carboxypeptidase regulatory-like domain-containing protein [Actinoplanes sp. ATCC 53533]|uniref:carboxypeptidase regulatory-like domain-containing protein n=1 Tax=Actinoplanes sp. ATCC 53533 TaxID=1288362 RepID=UPI0013152211|nr:carboxypeptidase regulatory-like domain-containing protein [Actinoplanes sp. ATCC 53533]